MKFKTKFTLIAGSVLVAAGLLAGAAFAQGTATPEAHQQRLEQAVKDGKLTQGAADVMLQLHGLRQAAMEKLQADSKALVDQAVQGGSITQAEADRMLNGHGQKGFGRGGKHGGFRQGSPMTQEELKAKVDAAVAEGKLTQEQADQILSGKVPFGGKRGGFGHGGFFMNKMPKQSQESTN